MDSRKNDTFFSGNYHWQQSVLSQSPNRLPNENITAGNSTTFEEVDTLNQARNNQSFGKVSIRRYKAVEADKTYDSVQAKKTDQFFTFYKPKVGVNSNQTSDYPRNGALKGQSKRVHFSQEDDIDNNFNSQDFSPSAPQQEIQSRSNQTKVTSSDLLKHQTEQMLRQKIDKTITHYSEYTVQFSLLRLLKFWMYHNIYHCLSFTVAIPVLIFDSKYLLNNMGFWLQTPFKQSFFLQLPISILVTLLTVGLMIVWLNFLENEFEMKNIYMEQIIFLYVHVLFRGFIIAVRYSFLSDYMLYKFKNEILNKAEVQGELLVINWKVITPVNADLEIDSAMLRNQVQDEFFKFQVLQQNDSKMFEKFLNWNYYDGQFSRAAFIKEVHQQQKQIKIYWKELINYRQIIYSGSIAKKKSFLSQNSIQPATLQSNKDEIRPENRKCQMFPCKLLMKEIALVSGCDTFPIALFSFIVSVGKVCIPYVIRWRDGIHPFNLDTPGIIYSIFEAIVAFYMNFINFMFISFGIVDFQRRVYQIQTCGALIIPDKSNVNINLQLFPTLNITCDKTIAAWLEMRNCFMDLGKKYYKRIQLYTSVLFIVCLMYLLLYLTEMYFLTDTSTEQSISSEISSIASQQSNSSSSSFDLHLTSAMNTFAFYDLIIIFVIIMVVLYYGSLINQQFTKDITQLQKIKTQLMYFRNNLSMVIEMKDNLRNQTLKAIVYLLVSDDLQLKLKNTREEERQIELVNIKEKIQTAIDMIETSISQLQIDYETKPLKIAGIPASFGLIQTILTTLTTIVVASMDKILK